VAHDGNNEQSFVELPLKPNGQIKTWQKHSILPLMWNIGVSDRISSDPQSPGMTRPMKFAGGAFRNTTLLPDPWRWASGRSASWREKIPTLGPPTLFMPIQQSPLRRPGPSELNERTDLRPKRAQGSPDQACESSLGDAMKPPRRAGRTAASGHLHDLLCLLHTS
jgi:hypothetical protein